MPSIPEDRSTNAPFQTVSYVVEKVRANLFEGLHRWIGSREMYTRKRENRLSVNAQCQLYDIYAANSVYLIKRIQLLATL